MLASSNYYFTSNCYFTGCSIPTTTKMRNALNPPLPWSKLNWPETTKKKWNHPCHDFETTWKPASYSLASFSVPRPDIFHWQKQNWIIFSRSDWVNLCTTVYFIYYSNYDFNVYFLLCLSQNLMLSFSNYIYTSNLVYEYFFKKTLFSIFLSKYCSEIWSSPKEL